MRLNYQLKAVYWGQVMKVTRIPSTSDDNDKNIYSQNILCEFGSEGSTNVHVNIERYNDL